MLSEEKGEEEMFNPIIPVQIAWVMGMSYGVNSRALMWLNSRNHLNAQPQTVTYDRYKIS